MIVRAGTVTWEKPRSLAKSLRLPTANAKRELLTLGKWTKLLTRINLLPSWERFMASNVFLVT